MSQTSIPINKEKPIRVISDGVFTDRILIPTLLRIAVWPYDKLLEITIEAASGTGAQYVRNNFGVEPELI